MNYEEKSKWLLKKCYEMESPKEFTEEFVRRFWSIIEEVNISLLSGEDNFFGQFIIQAKRKIDFKITWPISTVPTSEGYLMYYNPFLILPLTSKEVGALIKHEIYHIIFNHYERERSLKNKVSSLAINIAMDISINQYIKNLPLFAKKLDAVNLEYNLQLNEDMTIEQYATEIQKVINIRKNNVVKNNNDVFDKEVDLEKAHDSWEQSTLSLDNLKDINKRTSISAYKGKAPKDIEKMILAYSEKEEIVWQKLLRNVINSSRVGYKKTITRKDRRQPDRLDIRGKLPNSIPKIIVAIDISASMSDSEVKSIMKEILSLCKNKLGIIQVIECDKEIRRIYQLNTIKDIKPRLDKHGATCFSPVFEYIKENNLRNEVVIYFTDGVGEEKLRVKPINYRTIWVLTSDEQLSLETSYGAVTRLERVQKEKYDNTYGLQALREAIHDWAR